MKLLKIVLTCFATSITCSNLSAQDPSDLLQNREYKAAINSLTGDNIDDNLLILRARAQLLNGQFKDAVVTSKKLVANHPKSKWIAKATFIEAEAQSKLKRYDLASNIFENQAKSLFSSKYKDTGAKMLMEVAATFAYVPKTTELDKSKANIRKAVKLLTEALSLDCSLGMKEILLAELISLHIKNKKWNEAIKNASTYLADFDPDWKGPLGSINRITSNELNKVKLNGKNRRKIRFQLAEAYHRSNKRVDATRYLTELISELKKSNNPNDLALLADSSWLRLMALRHKGGKPRNLQSWITEVNTYLKEYPTHIHAQSTAYSIAYAYLSHGEKKNALNAFQTYIDNHHTKFSEKPITSNPESKKQLITRQKLANSRFELAHYELGKVQLELNEFQKAILAWKLYSQKFPNGSKWAECQKGLVNIDFRIATHAVHLIQKAEANNKGNARKTAQKALNVFINKYPLDNRVPTALFLTGNIPYQHAVDLDEKNKTADLLSIPSNKNNWNAAIKNWEILTTKYPRSRHAVKAKYLTAYIYENFLGDLEKALEIYNESSHRNAKSHITRLKAKHLTTSSSKAFTTTEKPHIKLNTRNIEEITVKQYWLDIKSYFRKERQLEDIGSLDIDLIEADKTWEVKIPNYKKYQSLDTKLDIPFPHAKAGICLIKVESTSFSSTTLVVRSNIDIAVRSNKEEVITYVHLAGQENRPAQNTEVLIADGGKIIANGKTNTQGIFHYRNDLLNKVKNLRVLAISSKGTATCALNIRHIRSVSDLKPKVWFNLAKDSYLPGETVDIAGAVRFPNEDISVSKYISPSEKQRNYTLSVKQRRSNKLLYQTQVKTSSRGIFKHSYQLPSYLSFANLKIELKADFDKKLPAFSHFFKIDKNSQSRITLKLEMDKKWTSDESVINGKVIAKNLWGAPYTNRKLNIHFSKSKSIQVKTDDSGVATFSYDSKYDEAGSIIEFTASTNNKKDTSNKAIVLIDPLHFTILASTDFASVAAGSDVTLTAKTLLPDETPVSRELKLEVFQIVNIKQNPILNTCYGLENLTKNSTREKIIQTIPLTTDAKTGKSQQILNLKQAGRYLLRITSKDRKNREVIAASFIDVHDASSQNKLVIFTDKRDLEVGKTITMNTYSYLKSTAKALLTIETNRIIKKKIITLKPGKNDIPINLLAAHAPLIRVNLIAIHDRKLHMAADTLPVVNKLTLKVTTEKVPVTHPYKAFDYKSKIQAFDAKGNPVPADLFMNLTHTSNALTLTKKDYSRLSSYSTGTNCGLIHEGPQEAILTEIRNELARLENGSSVSRHRPLAMQKAAFFRAAYNQNRTQMLTAVDQNWGETNISDHLITRKSLNKFLTQSNKNTANYITYDNNIYSELNNPNKSTNYNGRNFLGNSITLEQANELTQFGENQSDKQVYFGGAQVLENEINHLSTSLISLTSSQQITVRNTNALSRFIAIPKEGQELSLTDKLIYGDLKLSIYGMNDTNAFGSHQEELKTNLKTLKSKPRKDYVGIPVMANKTILTKNGSNKIRLKLPKDSKTTALKVISSPNHAAFLNDIITTPLVTKFGSSTPFHEGHPAGKLMAVCSYLDYLIKHNLDKPKQQTLKVTASRICAELTLSQKRNGTWSQIRFRKASSLMHTAIAYQALQMAKRLKITHDENTSLLAKAWISRQQKSLATKLYNSRAIVQLSLASSGDADFATCNRLYRERSKMDNIGKAILANVFVLLEKNDFTTTLLKDINDNINVKNSNETSLKSKILLNALTLNAQLATNQAPAMNTIQFTHHFSNDLERGIAAYSYSKFLQTTIPLNSKAKITLSINGKPLKNGLITANLLKAGTNEIIVKSTQDGAIVSTELIGRKQVKKQSTIKDFTIDERKYYKEKLTYKGLALRSKGTSPLTQTAIDGIVNVQLKGTINNKNYPDSILIEEIPAGFSYLPGSLKGNHSGARKEGNHLIITYGSLPKTFQLSYNLIAEHAGTWTHNPTTLSASHHTDKTSNNSATKLTVLAKGTKDNTPYQLNKNEHYELAQLYFKAKEYQQAKKHILAYRNLQQDNEDPELARMLLWIETEKPQPDAQLLADSFEILTERNPDLVIPFGKILKVGKAYRQLGEFERSMDVYSATIEAGFSADSYVGAALEDQDKFMLSVDYQNKLWLLYPDLNEINNSRFGLSQQVYAKASKAKSLGKNPLTKKLYTEKELIEISIKQTKSFLTHAPEHEAAADAEFSLVNALFALKNYTEVVQHTAKAVITHKDSKYLTSFRYMQALGNFWLRNYDEALKSASEVVKGNSDDKDLATFITAQIYHAKGMPKKAIEWYEGIKKKYPDAKKSIAYFEQKSISLDEVQVLDSGEKFNFKLKYRNIKEAQFQVYRVDLMKLYLREKNLSDISNINLAGITPKYSLTTKLGNGNDHKEKEKNIELPIAKDGAYLVICRGDYLHTSGLILITPLKLEVQESPSELAVRVNISDKKSGKYIDSVHVKAIGHRATKFKNGETDLRGVWQTKNIESPSTIIAKDPRGRYAFFRSEIAPQFTKYPSRPRDKKGYLSDKVDFKSNLKKAQRSLNAKNLRLYERKRRLKGKGVEINKARKK